MKKIKSLFIIKHTTPNRNANQVTKLTDPELKKITDCLEKAGLAWVYLPPGISHTVNSSYDDCEEDDDDC